MATSVFANLKSSYINRRQAVIFRINPHLDNPSPDEDTPDDLSRVRMESEVTCESYNPDVVSTPQTFHIGKHFPTVLV